MQALNKPPYRFNFSRQELAAIEKDCEGMSDGIMCKRRIQEEMGDLFLSGRCISHEKYDDAKKTTLKAYKDEVWTKFARDED